MVPQIGATPREECLHLYLDRLEEIALFRALGRGTDAARGEALQAAGGIAPCVLALLGFRALEFYLRRDILRRTSNQFDFEAPGSRFTMRPGFALLVGERWSQESEARSGVASEAIRKELGEGWLEPEPNLGEVRAVDGGQGRGASNWVPVLEWVGIQSAGGIVGMAAGQAALAGFRRIRDRLKEVKAQQQRVLISRGLAASLAIQHVFETTDEGGILNVEFCQEPSVLGGRPPTETTYTGLEPWIVSLVNGSRKTRYVLVVNPEGDIEGCIVAPAGEFDFMFGLLPRVE